MHIPLHLHRAVATALLTCASLAEARQPPVAQELASGGPLEVTLVSHPGEVDTRVDMELRPRTRSEQEPELTPPQCEGGPFSHLVFSGVVGESGITRSGFKGTVVGSGVSVRSPRDYRAERGRAITFLVQNPTGGSPWIASEVVRLPSAGEVNESRGRWTVSMEAPIAPGATGLVVVESVEDGTGAPMLLLEVRETGGSRSVRVEETR